MASLWHYLFLMIFSKSTPYLPGTAASCLGNIKVKKWTSTNRVNPRILSFSFHPWFFKLSSFLHRARQTPCLASKSKSKKQKHSEQRTLSCVFPSFLSLALIFISASSARRDNSRHTHIQCQNSPKNMITKKSKKRARYWSILDSYLYFFMERQARQVSKYPNLGKQTKKKNRKRKFRKKRMLSYFPYFLCVLGSYLHFSLSGARRDDSRNTHIQSQEHHKKRSNYRKTTKKEKGVVFANLTSLDLVFSSFAG